MKNTTIVVLLVFTAIICGCNKELIIPEIKNLELGHDNNKTVYIGDELKIDANIVAEDKIDRIVIGIHSEGHEYKLSGNLKHDDDWEVQIVYTKFRGQKNTVFLEHVEVPAHAKPGDYQLSLMVIDKAGGITSVEGGFEVKLRESK